MALYDISLQHEAQLSLAHLPVYLEARFGDAIWDWFTPDYKTNEMSNFRWCADTMHVIDSPTVRVRDDATESDDKEEEDYCALLVGEVPEHYMWTWGLSSKL